jgi:glycosyltransferase involved in cell wall biosynthesis
VAGEGKRIAAFVPNVLGFSPGQRFRIESWAGFLREAGWLVDFYPFEDARLHEVLYESGRFGAKALGLLSCYTRHLGLALRQPDCDVVYIYREMALIGPALLERIAIRSGVPVVYDIDDPIFLSHQSPTSGWFSLLKFPGKTHSLMRRSNLVIAINRVIADYAARFNPSVAVIPNFVDTDRYRPTNGSPARHAGPIRLVWMGSRSTMPNLAVLAEPLRRLQRDHPVQIRIVGVGQANLPGVEFDMRQWSAASEIGDLQDCDVGLVPVPDDPWNRWKFFLKVVQYMAVGLPVVASRVGSNPDVILDGVNGFLASSADEWYERLRSLVTNRALRERLAAGSRATAVEHFSSAALRGRVLAAFDRVLGG